MKSDYHTDWSHTHLHPAVDIFIIHITIMDEKNIIDDELKHRIFIDTEDLLPSERTHAVAAIEIAVYHLFDIRPPEPILS